MSVGLVGRLDGPHERTKRAQKKALLGITFCFAEFRVIFFLTNCASLLGWLVGWLVDINAQNKNTEKRAVSESPSVSLNFVSRF